MKAVKLETHRRATIGESDIRVPLQEGLRCKPGSCLSALEGLKSNPTTSCRHIEKWQFRLGDILYHSL